MKNVFNKVIGLITAVSIFLTAIPISSIFSALQNNYENYVIWDANPNNIEGGDGTSAQPSRLSGNDEDCSPYVAYKRTDEETPYFQVELKGSGDNHGAVISNLYNSNTAELKWLTDNSVAKAVAPYITMKYEMRTSGTKYNSKINITAASRNSQNKVLALFSSKSIDEANEWKQLESSISGFESTTKWNMGWIRVLADSSETFSGADSVTVDLKNVRLEVKESDRLAINAALKEVTTAATYFSTTAVDSNGNTDYFSVLVGYDRLSEYTENYYPKNYLVETDVTAGKGEITVDGLDKDNKILESETVAFTASPDYGYLTESVTVKDADGDDVAVKQDPENLKKYTFTMPKKDVKIYVAFKDDGTGATNSYIIWDANPNNIKVKDEESVMPDTLVTLTSRYDTVKRTDEEISYYHTEFKGNGDGANAVFQSGLSASSSGMGWMGNLKVLQAIDEFMVVKYDYRANGPAATVAHTYIHPIQNGSGITDNSADFGAVKANSENVWQSHNDEGVKGITFKKTWQDGWINYNPWAEAAVTSTNYINVDIRKLRIELEGSDRIKINQALSQIDGIDNIQGFTKGVDIGLDTEGNKDYFSLLIAYDEESAYTENTYPAKHTITTKIKSGMGTVKLLGTRLGNKGPEGETITVVPTPSKGYTFKSISAENADGTELVLQKSGDNYTFVMPSNAVKLYAEFEDDGTGVRDNYVIWDINPDDLKIKDGESASPTSLNINQSAYKFIKKEDEAISYFSTTLNGQGDGANALLAGSLTNNTEGFGWMDSLDVLEVLSDGYMQVKYDIRTGGPAWNTTLYPKATRDYLSVSDTLSDWGKHYVASEPDVWVSRDIKASTFEYNWYSGYFHVNGWAEKPISSTNYMVVDIRNLRIELKESDRLAINEALAGIKGIDNIDKFTKDVEIGTDSNGNKDYFSLLVKYDSRSGLSPNKLLTEVKVKGKIAQGNGKIEFVGLDENDKAGIDAEVTVKLTPATKYLTAGITVEDSNGNSVDAVKVNDNEYKFIVPSGHTTVSAVFERDQLQNEYVIFEANPDTVKASELDCSVENNGSAIKGYDLNGNNYYSLAMQGNGKKAEVNILSGKNSQSAGYMHLANKELLTALAKFATVRFDYKSNNALPGDAKLEIYAGNTLLASTSIAKSSDWINYSAKIPNNTVFSDDWSDGNLTVKLVSASGGVNGKFNVDISNFRIEVAEIDRTAISEAISPSNSGLTFANIIEADMYSAYSTTEYEKYSKLFVQNPDFADVSLSAVRGAYGETVTISATERTGHVINTVTAVDSNGNKVGVTPATGGDYTFTVPLNVDVYVNVDTYSQEELASMRLMWYSNASSSQALPYFIDVSERPYSYSMIDAGEGQSGYAFKITKAEGALNIYGTQGSLPLNLFLTNAEISFRAKVETADGADRVIKVGSNLGSNTKEITVGSEWTQFSISAKDIIGDGNSLSFITYSLDGMQVGDKLSVGEIYLWSQTIADISDYDKYKIAYDISGYEKFDTNTLLREIGDTTSATQPWNETDEMTRPDGSAAPRYVSWDNGWYDKFQNKNSWNISPSETYDPTYKYILAFYGNGVVEESISAADCAETGYMEFYIKSTLDGLNVPLVLSYATDSGQKLLNLPIRYEKSNARDDGWMQVRVSYAFLAGMGVNLAEISFVKISSNIKIDASFQLSSFRFYDRYADNPDPDPIVEEVIVERDIPLDMDGSLLNVYLDKENLKLYVPYDTYIWEVLAAANLDTAESNLRFMNLATGMGVYDTETVIGDNMTMTIYRRGYELDTFQIIVATEEQGKKLGITKLKDK